MNYLSASDYEVYGLESTTTQGWCVAASALIDAHCRRPTLAVAQYTERLLLAAGRNSVRLTYLPLATVAPATTPLITVRGRYALPRRGESGDAAFAASIAQAFALPGAWTTLDPASVEYSTDTGDISLPANALGLTYNEVEVTYSAGLAVIPDAVKSACAQIVRNAQSTPALNVRASTVDRMHLEYFADALVDASVRALLAPYVAQKVN